MSEAIAGKVEFETVSIHRHLQRGYFSLSELPQNKPIGAEVIGTGWWELDEIFKMYPSQFVMVTGVSNHGKSTMILNLVCNVARLQGIRTFMHVPENEVHLRAKLRGIWGVSSEGWDYFAKHQCYIQSSWVDSYDEPAHTLQWVLDSAIVAIENDGVSLILIDPWNELDRARPPSMLMTDYIGVCLMYLKQFARHYNVTVILVAHPTKAGIADGKVPSLSDIEGSMNWFNKCDNGLIVVRGAGNAARIISAKVREHGAGRRGECHFTVDPDTGIWTAQHGAVSL